MKIPIAIFFVFSLCRASLADVYISLDVTLNASTSFPFDTVAIYDGDDGPTTVFMVDGGLAYRLEAHDRTTLYVSGGGTSGADMTVSDDATLYFSGGVVIDDLRAHDRGTIYMTGGEVLHGSIHATDDSTINIYGGLISHLAVDRNATINVFGRELAFSNPDQLRLIGILADGSPLDIPVQRFDAGVISLHVVPEPSANVLAALGLAGCVVTRLWRHPQTIA